MNSMLSNYTKGLEFFLSSTKRLVLQLSITTLVVIPITSFSQDYTLVQMTKRNAPNFAIDGDHNGESGQNVHLWRENFHNVNQQWHEIDRGNGHYSYRKVDTNTCLDGRSGSGENGQNVHLWTCSEDNYNQHWLKSDVGDGYYRLEKRNAPGFSLDGRHNGNNGQNVHLWSSINGNQNQHWLFKTVTKTYPTVQMTKRNASTFAIDGNNGADFFQDVFLWRENRNNVNQQWYEINRGNGYFSYQKVDTDFCLDGNWGGAQGQNIYLWKCRDNNHNQHWLKVDAGDGYYRLEKRNAPGFSLDGRHGGDNRQSIHLWNSNNSNENQHWRINLVRNQVTTISTPGTPTPVTTVPPVQTPAPVTPPIAIVSPVQTVTPVEETDSNVDATRTPTETNNTADTISDLVETDQEAVDFLIAASFGPTDDTVDELQRLGYSEWFKQQTNLPTDSFLTETRSRLDSAEPNQYNACLLDERFSREAWMKFAVTNEDQLRQRVAFALSQLFVVATNENNVRCKSWMQGDYLDVLQEGAFGNFRDVLEDVTYHPFMARWLTYLNNEKADPRTGSMPDENYAREIMQLFTIGLIELNMDGSHKLDNNGQPLETYTQEDITELAKVFTGLHLSGLGFDGATGFDNDIADITPLEMDNEMHSPGEKTVLGQIIPEYNDGDDSISDALDILADHPNTAPFVAKHLIKRLTTSNPSAAYISGVANAFKSGSFTLPDGDIVGSQTYGDLEPTVAAVLFFEEARSDDRFENDAYGNMYGKVREPILRFVQWARVSGVRTFGLPGFSIDATHLGSLGQDLPIRAASVFNFFRPGYMAAGSETAEAGLVAPELQIEFGPNMIEYANSMRAFIFTTEEGARNGGYFPNYDESGLLEKSTTPEELVNYLNLIYTANRLHPDTIEAMINTLETISPDNALLRLQMASAMIVNTTEYKTQK